MLGIRVYQAVTVLLATGSAASFVHWLAALQEPIAPARNELGFLASLVFLRATAWAGYPTYFAVTLGLLAIAGLSAAILAIVLALKTSDRIEARRLGLSLALGAASVAYFYFATSSAAQRAMIGWSPVSPWRLSMDMLAYLAAGCAPVLLGRFFLGYPRAATEADWKGHFQRKLAAAREAVRRGGGHYRLLPGPLRERMAAQAVLPGPLKGLSEEAQVARSYRILRFLESRTLLFAAGAWAIAVASLDWLDAAGAGGPTRLGKVVAASLYLPFLALSLSMALESMGLRREGTFDEDRRRVDWIRSTLMVGGLAVATVFPLTMAAGLLSLRRLADASVFVPAQVLFIGPTFVAVVLLSLTFLLALALSIFYRGAVDPRLAARKVTLLGAIGLIVTFLFVLLERTVAAKIASWLGLSPDSGALIAGAAVASTIVPVRNRTEKAVNGLVGRWLPLDSVIEGERRSLAVAISDLSGYTALSSRDEKQALLLAALLQRQAARLVQSHGGRIVKSMGDAVLFAFEDVPTAARVLSALHRDFRPAAEQLGLEPLAVHSGAHWGEVTVAHDGDIYGQTVNIAARIQGSAETGQVVASKAFADLARDAASFRALGSRQFKNVAEPVLCEEMAAS